MIRRLLLAGSACAAALAIMAPVAASAEVSAPQHSTAVAQANLPGHGGDWGGRSWGHGRPGGHWGRPGYWGGYGRPWGGYWGRPILGTPVLSTPVLSTPVIVAASPYSDSCGVDAYGYAIPCV